MASLLSKRQLRQLPSSLVNKFSISGVASPLSLNPRSLISGIQKRTIASADIDATKGDRERVVVLGSGWGGHVFARNLNPKKYQAVVVSPRSYFAFTPLLSDACVGNLDFNATIEPIRNKRSNAEFFQAWADDLDLKHKRLTIEENILDPRSTSALITDRFEGLSPDRVQLERKHKKKQGQLFDITYDKLVIAVGCYAQTFGTKGVKEFAFFLKDVGDARKIRRRVFEAFEIAALPTTSNEMRKALLHFVAVGGGPIGMEFAGNLSDLISQDLLKIYPFLEPFVRITVYDVAPKVLSMFDESLGEYAMKIYKRQGINIRTSHHVEELRPGLPNEPGENITGVLTIKTKEEGEIGTGMCVWATGNKANPFVRAQLEKPLTHAEFPYKTAELIKGHHHEHTKEENEVWKLKQDPKTRYMMVDPYLRVKMQTQATEKGGERQSEAVLSDVFALGDCAIREKDPLPALAQVANQQAIWLAKHLNRLTHTTYSRTGYGKPFEFRSKGVTTYIGSQRGLFQSAGGGKMEGRKAWLAWKGTYIYLSLSWRRRLMVASYWILNAIWGRDVSRY
ncbi:MAG: hypothetical protein M1834_008800 [Cirrosporium novae-zelandiae]|nr:MAG: hypothetical protein M1834_008800 [Cirrosporium novae-zelandiae]